MKHYYTDNTDLESKDIKIEFKYKDHDLIFSSDNGVFSKNFIDYGSRVLLENISIDNDKKCLDVGCGYGTFGIALVKNNPTLEFDMVDVNDRAIKLSLQNAELNGVVINAFKSYIYEKVESKYDVIITNPPIRAGKEVVMEIISESIHHLNDKGEVWVIIQKKQGAPSVKKKLEDLYGNCEVVKRDKGYYLLKSDK